MSAFDTAKEIVRIGVTAGLSQDVISLLEKKASLLAEQVTALEREKTQFQSEVAHLRQQIQRTQPDGLIQNMGVFWKRSADGFEKIPYCGECAHHPIMTPRWHAKIYICSAGHQAPIYVEPPSA